MTTVHTFLVLSLLSSFYSFSFSLELDYTLLSGGIQPEEKSDKKLYIQQETFATCISTAFLVTIFWVKSRKGRGKDPAIITVQMQGVS